MGEARRRKLAGTMPEKTAKVRKPKPRKPILHYGPTSELPPLFFTHMAAMMKRRGRIPPAHSAEGV